MDNNENPSGELVQSPSDEIVWCDRVARLVKNQLQTCSCCGFSCGYCEDARVLLRELRIDHSYLHSESGKCALCGLDLGDDTHESMRVAGETAKR